MERVNGAPMLRSTPFLVAVLLVTVPVALAPAAGAPSPAPSRFVVGFDAFVVPPLVGGAWHGARVLDRDTTLDIAVFEASDPALFLKRALADPTVRFVEPDPEDAFVVNAVPNDPRVSEQYALPAVRAFDAWDVTRGSTGVVIAVVDSGVDVTHPDLGPFVPGVDFTGQGMADGCRHGTHVAGVAAARAGNGVGVAGVAEASIMPVKVLKSSCSGSFSAVAKGIRWAADNDADVITLSLGCRTCFSQAVADAVTYATARGALVVAAAGNQQCYNCVDFPASHPDVIAVTCTEDGDASCLYSSTGKEAELSAPGDRVLSTYAGGGYASLSGTSMSAPHVAGVAALVLSLDPALTPADVRAILRETARDVGPAGHDDFFGHGIVNAHAAVSAVKGAPAPAPAPAPGPEPAPTPGNEAPSARFTATTDGLTVHVDASASTDADGAITAWSWTWGDGATGTGVTASRTYAGAGTFTVTLTVKDDAGATATATRTVSVERAGVLFHEDFSDGRADAAWSLDGLWRVGDACTGGSGTALQFNTPSSCTYSTGFRATGAATIVVDTSAKAAPRLSFTHAFGVESYGWPYDVMRVEVSTDGGASWTTLAQWDSRDAAATTWQDVTLDLSGHRAENARVRFTFDSQDGWYNAYPGWVVREVTIA